MLQILLILKPITGPRQNPASATPEDVFHQMSERERERESLQGVTQEGPRNDPRRQKEAWPWETATSVDSGMGGKDPKRNGAL